MILPVADRRARFLAHLFLWLVPPAYGALALRLGMDANWDLRNYHWYNAYAFLEGRIGFDLLPAQMPTFYNPLLDVPFYLAATAWPAPVAGFLLGTVQGVNLSLAFALALVALRPVPEWPRLGLAAVLGLMAGLGGGTLGLLGTTFQDNVVSLGVLGALLVVLADVPALTRGPARPAALRAAAAGLLAGAAMGLKTPMAVYPVGLCVAFLVLPGGLWRRLWLAFVFGLGTLAGVAATSGFWMWHLWQEYGNPLFPHMNQIFRSPFAAPDAYRNLSFLPADLWDRLLFPFLFTADPLRTGEVAWFDLRIAVLFVLVPLAILAGGMAWLLGRRARPVGDPAAARFVLVALAVAYGLWVWLFGIYRYLVPAEMAAPLAIVLAAGLLPLGRGLRLGLAAVLLVVVQATAEPADWGRVAWSRSWVEAEVPPIEAPHDTMLLMAGYWATSHVLPLLPPEMPAVRIQSNFLQPDSVGNAYLGIVRRRVAAHDGRFLMLSTVPDTRGAARAAELMGLRLDPDTCRPLPNNLGEALNLCTVRRPTAAETAAGPVHAVLE